MMKLPLHLLRSVYFDTLSYARENAYPENLKGLCSIAAYELAHRIRRHGFKADFVLGTYAHESHCWVETREEILDPTILQFFSSPEPDDPDWGAMQCALNEPIYVAEARGLKAVRILDSEWFGRPELLSTWKSAIRSDKIKKSVSSILADWRTREKPESR